MDHLRLTVMTFLAVVFILFSLSGRANSESPPPPPSSSSSSSSSSQQDESSEETKSRSPWKTKVGDSSEEDDDSGETYPGPPGRSPQSFIIGLKQEVFISNNFYFRSTQIFGIGFRRRAFIRPKYQWIRGPTLPRSLPYVPPSPPLKTRPSTFQGVICEGKLGQFRCLLGKMKIESAVYGRQKKDVCFNSNLSGMKQDTNCKQDVTAVLQRWCDNKTQCFVKVTNTLMKGDPCPKTYKYLSFTVRCVQQKL